MKVNPCMNSLNILLKKQINVTILPPSCLWCMTLMYNFPVSWHTYSLLKESRLRTLTKQNLHMSFLWSKTSVAVQMNSFPKIKILANQGSDNVTRRVSVVNLQLRGLIHSYRGIFWFHWTFLSWFTSEWVQFSLLL